MRRLLSLAALATLALPAAGSAQALRTQCEVASSPERQTFCENVADAAVILQPRLGLALTGGNPVSGTASTLGMRIGTLPRVSLGLRISAAEAALPAAERLTSDKVVDFPVGSINADLSIGVLPGLSLLPTVGGFASFDVLASVGTLPLPRGEGFDDSSAFSWALGGRLGLLRESFTAPGVSVSAMYRRLGDADYGSITLTDRDAFFRISDQSVTSVRGTIGKRLFGFGFTGGAGWDRYTGDVTGRVQDGRVLDPGFQIPLEQPGLSQTRTSLFGNVSFTLLILNMAGEIGWQQGAEPIEDATDRLERRGLFGGFAVRLAI